MPNYDTHAGIAAYAFPEKGVEYAAGETFDDIVRMAGGFPGTTDDNTLFYEGRRNNNSLTDPAFDGQIALREALSGMRADIAERRLDQRWSRLAGPATDILFSGVSQQISGSAYLEVCKFLQSPQGEELISNNTRPSKSSGLTHDEVCANVGKIVERGLIVEYADPELAVKMLRKRVARRNHLTLPESREADASLTEVFAAQQARLAKVADVIYAGTVAMITGDPTNEVLARTNAPLLPIVPHVSSVTEKASGMATISHIEDWPGILDRERAGKDRGNEQFEKLLAASRAAAHFLLQRVARHQGIVTISRRGISAPYFPEPWVGSISHSQNWAAAAIARSDHYKGLGIDLECRFSGTRGRSRVLTPLEGSDQDVAGISTRTMYSIKEAVFKAVHPLVSNGHPEKFYYQDAEIVRIDPVTRRLAIRPTTTDSGRRIGRILGDADIACYYLEKPEYSSAVCVVR